MIYRPDKSCCIKPAALRPGCRIAIAAPASPFDREAFLKGIEMMKQMGYEPVFSGRIFSQKGYFAGECSQRARELQDFFDDPEICAIWCVRGGYGSMRVLESLDYKQIQKFPKIFVGCSDITALLAAFYKKCRMITFHGPMVASLASADEHTIKNVFAVLSGNMIPEVSAVNGQVICHGNGTGIVLGGNLSTLCHLLSTPFFPDLDGKIFFIEDVGEKPYRIDRMLSQMRMAGCFDRLAGLAGGSFIRCGPAGELKRIFADIFSKSDFPVITGFPAGHDMPNKTLPMGAVATLDSQTMSLVYHQSIVCQSKPVPEVF